MLLCSVKIKKHTVTLVSLICVAVFVLVCFFSLKLSPSDVIDNNGKALSLTARDESDITAFLSEAGYESAELLYEREVVIPAQWNEDYASYAQMQKEQGFDLNRYKGKPAAEYTYSLKEYDKYAVVLVSDGRIVALHLSELDGSGDTEPLISKSRGGS